MIDSVTFLNDRMIWQVIVVGLLLWGVFIWKEYSQFASYKFWIKTLIAFIAIVSLGAIALQPAIFTSKNTTKAIVLTDGYNNKQLDSLKKVYKRIKVLQYNPNEPIFNKETTINSLFVLGNGVEPFDFWQLENSSVKFLQGNQPSGITQYKYTSQIKVGEKILLKGAYNNPNKGNILFLNNPAGVTIDSVILNTGKKQEFELAAKLNIKGNHLYELIEKDSLNTILSKDLIPVVAEESNPLKILVINNFPTFETKYLKNYLASLGHELVVKTKITKGKYKFEYFNTKKMKIGALSEKTLDKFDLVVIDAFSLKNLGRSKMALENSIRKNGLGVFVQSDHNYFKSSKNVESFNFVSDKRKEATLKKFLKNKISKNPYVFVKEFGVLPIHEDIDHTIVSGYKRLGNGRIGGTVLENTYELLLNGNTTMYKQIWSDIVGNISNREISSSQWQTQTVICSIDQPFQFSLRTSVKKPTVITSDGYSIAMLRDLNVENLWHGISYPKESGWKKLFVPQDSTAVLNYFVTDTINWKSSKDFDRIRKNKRQFDQPLKETKNDKVIKPIPLIWFFCGFLICSAILWLEPKISKD